MIGNNHLTTKFFGTLNTFMTSNAVINSDDKIWRKILNHIFNDCRRKTITILKTIGC